MKEKEALLSAKRIKPNNGSKDIVMLKVQKKPPSDTNSVSIQKLLTAVIKEHSFDYNSLADAKKTVCVDGMEYCFDAFSLCDYSSNLTKSTLHTFKRMLWEFCEKNFDKEHRKQMQERDSLFRFLQTDNCPYRNYRITKSVRPDFILEGDAHIGVEVTELTSPNDQILKRISNDYYGQGMSAEEIKKAASKRYKSAKNYEYKNVDGRASIWSGLIDLNKKRKGFALQLLEKYCKYEKEREMFDEFIVLADAEISPGIAISCQEDVDAIFDNLQKNPEINKTTFVIMWQENSKTGRRVSYCKL